MDKVNQTGNRYHLIIIVLMLTKVLPGFGQQSHRTDNLKYFNADDFPLEGSVIPDSLKERRYDRLPLYSKGRVHPHVWYLSRTSAGLAVRFQSNASVIAVKWEVLRNEDLNHMAATGVKGLDLYCKTGNVWRYVNTAKPSGKKSKYILINDSSNVMRDYRLYLPLYDGIESLKIGFDSKALVKKPDSDWSMKPIIFYGTSITQGGCASRPGMVYTNIISRKLNVECINLGFSGNGRMEEGVAEAMADMDASMYVIDCIGNMTVEQIHRNVNPLVGILRDKRPYVPIVFVECMMHERAYLNDSLRSIISEKNNALKAEYVDITRKGEDNVYYIGLRNATGKDHEGTVDGIHLTDLGFLRFSDYLISKFESLGLINSSLAGSPVKPVIVN